MPQLLRLPLLLALLSIVSSARADAQYVQIPVPTCAHADSLLGPLGDDSKGLVRRFRHTTADSTFFITGAGTGVVSGNQPRFFLLTGIGAPVPRLRPDAQLTVILRGRTASELSKSVDEPRIVLLLDETPPRELTVVGRGEFVGARGMPITLPVSAAVWSDDLLAMARAERAVIRIATVDVRLGKEDRRDLRALYRATACEHPD